MWLGLRSNSQYKYISYYHLILMRSVLMAYLVLSGVNIKKHTFEYLCTTVNLINKQDGINELVSNEKVLADLRKIVKFLGQINQNISPFQ